ncbi:hypothetical protein [Pseudomonas sp. B392_1p]|uniref:hypothetical protein n=1 Tax=Pseudomonas sp. B392_1p TaxID=3457507 RepID=UPI003FD33EAA
MDKQAKQSAWEPGMEVSSEAQYHEVTERLARELLQAYTPEQLAVITAQHLIYVDGLKSGSGKAKESIQRANEIIQAKNVQIQHEILKNEDLSRNTARISKIVLEAWKNKTTKKRMSGLDQFNEDKSAAIERAQVIAKQQWQADAAKEIRIGNMADRVYRALVDEGFKESLPDTPDRLKQWIKPVAPKYASQAGRSRKTS